MSDSLIFVSQEDANDARRRNTNNQGGDNNSQNLEETNENKKKKWKWNVFTEDGSNQQSVSEKKYDKSLQTKYKLLKLGSILGAFCLTLAAGVVSKGATFFMVSQIKDDELKVCPEKFGYFSFENNQITNVTAVLLTETERVGWIWALFFCFLAGEVFVFIRSFRVVFMKSFSFLGIREFLFVLFMETLHVCGTALLFLVALPELDSLRAIMATDAVAFVPGIFKCINRGILMKNIPDIRGKWKIIVDIVAVALQFAIILVWPIAEGLAKSTSKYFPYFFSIGLILTSFGWWESYIRDSEDGKGLFGWLSGIKTKMTIGQVVTSKNKKLFKKTINIPFTGIPIQFYASDDGSERLKSARGPTYLFISLWKMLIFFTFMTCILPNIGTVSGMKTLFNNFVKSFENNEYIAIFDVSSMAITDELIRWEKLWNSQTFVIVVQICSSWILYSLCKFSCKSNIEWFGFALPMTLVTPVCIWTLWPLCVYRNRNPCNYSSSFPKYLFFNCPADMDFVRWAFTDDWAFFGIFVLSTASLVWISSQIWHLHEKGILLETYQIFSKYYYNGLLVDSSIMLNKKYDTKEVTKADKKDRKIPMIYGCATMWHESSEEIKVCLKSMFKMDDDYCVRHLRAQIDGIKDDLYEWESHIFFDDAMTNMMEVKGLAAQEDGNQVNWFEMSEDEQNRKKKQDREDKAKIVVNSYVLELINTVKQYGEEWYDKVGVDFNAPRKYLTPYGGRLEWNLPGGTKLIAHLKDKSLIRNKKRWSQIMYMYYFLGFKLKENEGKEEKKIRNFGKNGKVEVETKNVEQDPSGKNTFLLALDGDVDFLPDAVIKVVDILEKNDGVGAACGRIHPTGGGYMTWYQKFEYAIGHWLQKSTEHVLGCVLCSPGCFSLFRGQALMTNNVMKTYSTVATEPEHYIQYDQGEDRWLCTLMLKQGWRVEYAAASDSYTACPQGFGEFYNQRRRWMPSTMLNVIDLLGDWGTVIKSNDDISSPYMCYQAFNLVGSIIGPGSILLMLIGAFALAFGLSSSTSLILNLVLIGIFIFACVSLSKDQQIMIAQLLTFLYAIIMIAVYIGIIIQIIDDGPLSLSALGFFFTFGSFVVAALFHPQEWTDLFCCVIYVATIPSMYLLLTVFAVFNMNDVSWGTREAPKVMDPKEAAKKKAEAKKKEGLSGLFRQLVNKGTSSFSKIYSQMSASDNKIMERLDKLENVMHEYHGKQGDNTENNRENTEAGNASSSSNQAKSETEEKDLKKRQDFWINNNEDEREGSEYLASKIIDESKMIDKNETEFWENLIEEFLKPYDDLKGRDKKKKQLLDYKNKVALGFVIVNAMWVTAIYMLQAYTMVLGMKWPLGAKGPTLQFDTSNPEEATKIVLVYEYLRLEPVGLVFVVSFIFVIILQSVGMVFHCVETLEQIVAHTYIRKAKKEGPEKREKQIISPLDLLDEMREEFKEAREKHEKKNQSDQTDGTSFVGPAWAKKNRKLDERVREYLLWRDTKNPDY